MEYDYRFMSTVNSPMCYMGATYRTGHSDIPTTAPSTACVYDTALAQDVLEAETPQEKDWNHQAGECVLF